MVTWWRRILAGFVVLVATAVWAQQTDPVADIPRRDPQQLAVSLLSATTDPVVPELTPRYERGQVLDFWVGQTDSPTPTRITATLVGASGRAYIWVDNALGLGNVDASSLAGQVGQLYTFFRLRSTYRVINLPDIGSVQDSTDLLPVPDVDNDPRLYVVFTNQLADDRDALINPVDSLPTAYAPSGISNQHETLFITAIDGVALTDPAYAAAIARGVVTFVLRSNNPEGAAWLEEAFRWLLLFRAQQAGLQAADYDPFLSAPDTPLTQPAALTTRSQTLAAQQLFLNYLTQRYGQNLILDLFLQPGRGLSTLDPVLANVGRYDPVTGAAATARDAFADFVIANLLNVDFGDRRYRHVVTPLENTQRAQGTALELGDLPAQTVNQFGTAYYVYSTTNPATFELTITGRESVERLPMDRDPAERFYWSGWGADQVRTMTRAFDLSGVEAATLSFDAWWDTADAWNYGYVAVSTDDGATWTILEPPGLTTNNRYGAAYGVGFTGISNPEPPRPFPIMGVVMSGDGVTIQQVVAGGAAATAGVQVNDQIIGYEGELWTTTPDVISLLANYAPGDTLNLLIQRGGDQVEIPVVLGAHPTRVVYPEPLWQAHTVDLTPYAGGDVLIRFLYITYAGREDQGLAVDNIAVPELDFVDDGAWDFVGWSEIDNRVPQDLLVQAVTIGSESVPRVQRLIDGTNGSGTWTFPLAANDNLLIAVSGVSDETRQRAEFDVSLRAN